MVSWLILRDWRISCIIFNLIKANPSLRRQVLSNTLGLGSDLHDVPVLLIIPTGWSRDVRLALIKMLLEDIGVGGVHIDECSVMAAFGCAAPTALVVDIGHSITEVTVILDGEVAIGASEVVPVGGADIEKYLVILMEKDGCLRESGKGHEDILRDRGEQIIMARNLKESEACHPVRNDQIPPFTFKFHGIDFSIGEGRINAIDVLFNPELVGKETPGIADAIMTVVNYCDADKRPLLLDHIILTGLSTKIPMRNALEFHLKRLLPVSEFCGESQSRGVRFRTVPEYYPEIWQKAGPNAAWFGGGITAKCVLNDSRNYYTREDLLQHGHRIFSNKPLC